jgi:hypothetical protein
MFQARSLVLYEAEKTRGKAAGLPPFDAAAAGTRCDAMEAAIGVFIDAVRAEIHGAPLNRIARCQKNRPRNLQPARRRQIILPTASEGCSSPLPAPMP